MSDELLEMIPILAVLAEAMALVWVFVRKNMSGIVLVNALVAATVTLLVAPKLNASIGFADWLFLAQIVVMAFALATLATSVSWLAHPVEQPLMVWTEFSVMAGVSVAFVMVVVIVKVAQLV
jgi:hypothetical protein